MLLSLMLTLALGAEVMPSFSSEEIQATRWYAWTRAESDAPARYGPEWYEIAEVTALGLSGQLRAGLRPTDLGRIMPQAEWRQIDPAEAIRRINERTYLLIRMQRGCVERGGAPRTSREADHRAFFDYARCELARSACTERGISSLCRRYWRREGRRPPGPRTAPVLVVLRPPTPATLSIDGVDVATASWPVQVEVTQGRRHFRVRGLEFEVSFRRFIEKRDPPQRIIFYSN